MSRFSGPQADGAKRRAKKQRREEAEARAKRDPIAEELLADLFGNQEETRKGAIEEIADTL